MSLINNYIKANTVALKDVKNVRNPIFQTLLKEILQNNLDLAISIKGDFEAMERRSRVALKRTQKPKSKVK